MYSYFVLSLRAACCAALSFILLSRLLSAEEPVQPDPMINDISARASAHVVPLPGHPEQPLSARYRLIADGESVEVKAERFDFDVAMFTLGDAAIEVVVEVTEDFSDYSLKPFRHNINVSKRGNSLSFILHEAHKLVLQIPGRTPLAIIVTPPESNVPEQGDPNLRYFGPGIHVAGIIAPLENETLYFAPGALVKGRIEARDVNNVSIRGRGFLETEGYSTRSNREYGILFDRCSDIYVEGVALRSYHSWWQMLFLNTTDALVEQVNLFGIGVNTDGVDIDAVKDFVVRDSFIRAEDDGLGWHSLDAKTNGEMITERVLADNIVIWNTRAGNGVRIGASMEAQLWRDITLRNIDILEHSVRGAGLYSDYSDWAWMQDLRFENIRIERPSKPIDFRIAKTRYSNSTDFLDERGHFDGLLFENISMNGGVISLKGYDATHRINGVRFNNCTNLGVPITFPSQLTLNEYVTDLAFNEPLPAREASSPGVLEFEDLESVTNSTPHFITDAPEASGGRLRHFKAEAVGDYIEHHFTIFHSKPYQLSLCMPKTSASGCFQLSLNGVDLGDPVDLYSEGPSEMRLSYGEVPLDAGPQILRMTVTSKNAASLGYYLTMDSIKVLSALESWREKHFGITDNIDVGADTSDGEHDGRANLIEFALGSSPIEPDGRPFTIDRSYETGELGFSFLRRDPAHVDYILETTRDLADEHSWQPIATLFAGNTKWSGTVSVEEIESGHGMREVAISIGSLKGGAGTPFFRLRVE